MNLPVLRLLRPHQYVKNGFVLIGVIFARQWDWVTLGGAALVFTAFCAAASAVYVLNDLMDVEADRRHPVKCRRPIASGAVPETTAKWLALALAIIAAALAFCAGWAALGFVVAYGVLNLLYSWRLKHVVILDVFLIAAGFMLRILAGTAGLGIAPSQWLLLCGLMLTLFLGFAKRRAELLMLERNGEENGKGGARRVLEEYDGAMLDQFTAVTAACTILSYGLYTVSADTMQRHGSADLIYTVPFVVYGMFRYLYLLHGNGKGDDAASDFMTDRHLLATVAAWLAVTAWLLM